jgi:PiT family inorganic phosphate transporter
MDTGFIVAVVVVTALAFDFTNGFHDSGNAMATSVATGAMRPRIAVVIGAVLNIVGALLSTEVAKTISGGIVNDNLVTPVMVFAGLCGAIVWNLLTWLFGLPSSSSHALFGGLIGAVLIGAGASGINFSTIVSKILLPTVISPVVAGIAALMATFIAYKIATRGRDTSRGFKRGQVISSSMVALAHGTSDGQKTMGVITLVLITANMQRSGTGPQLWVIFAAGLAIGLGTLSGGWRIMRTMGRGLVDIEPPQGLAASASSASAILAASHFGFGLSTTQVCSGSILGSGVGRRLAEIRWGTAGRMVIAWVFTLPAAAVVGGLCAAVANTGTVGTMLVFAALVGSAASIWTIAQRNAVTAHNVIDTHTVAVLPQPVLVPA